MRCFGDSISDVELQKLAQGSVKSVGAAWEEELVDIRLWRI